jgi:hypothetical protein
MRDEAVGAGSPSRAGRRVAALGTEMRFCSPSFGYWWLPGFRPGAERRGKPNLAARVMIAATERPRRVEISSGVFF